MNTGVRRSPAFLVSGTHSGVGKTTVTLLLMRALRERGYVVQPFKVGPDFIDSAYHKVAAGHTSINLDLWMMGLTNIRKSFNKGAEVADVCVVEGMGGLFDGGNGSGDRGSSAFLARKLGIPVVLVVDVWGMTRSVVALIEGFIRFDTRVSIAGIVLNRAGSKRHFEMVMRCMPPRLRKMCLGYVLHDDILKISERHLGLLTVEESETKSSELDRRWLEVSQSLDVSMLVRKHRIAKKQRVAERSFLQSPKKIRLGVAKDRAFCFYYAENLEMLEKAGAELCFFSPIDDQSLPPGLDGLYIGGGYPESFAPQLSHNKAMRTAVRLAGQRGMPIYAECGGLMYLGRAIKTFEGNSYSMVSIFPLDVVMDRHYLAINYVKIQTFNESVIGPSGLKARGQEFHQSRLFRRRLAQPTYRVTTSTGEHYNEGFSRRNVLGSYVHLHFVSNPQIPRCFVQRCLDYRYSIRD